MNEQRHMLTLPAKIADMDELTRLVSDRFRRIGEILGSLGLDSDQDMHGHRVRHLGPPVADSDAVTLGYLRQALGRVRAGAAVETASQSITVGVTGAAIEIVRVILSGAAVPIAVSGAAEGVVVALLLEQDATGGRTVAWPPTWTAIQAIQPGPTPETYSCFLFGFLSATDARLLAPPLRDIPLL